MSKREDRDDNDRCRHCPAHQDESVMRRRDEEALIWLAGIVLAIVLAINLLVP